MTKIKIRKWLFICLFNIVNAMCLRIINLNYTQIVNILFTIICLHMKIIIEM